MNVAKNPEPQTQTQTLTLTLTLKMQHSLVGSVEKRGISGGQRKRVNIGLELVAKPSLLFMDEPTSGLDATAATDILTALRRWVTLFRVLMRNQPSVPPIMFRLF